MIKDLVRKELLNAIMVNGQHHSKHEAYAVLKEEIEEAEDEIKELCERVDVLWFAIRKDWDKYIEKHLELLGETTDRAIKELIQVAAMIEKFKIYERECKREKECKGIQDEKAGSGEDE